MNKSTEGWSPQQEMRRYTITCEAGGGDELSETILCDEWNHEHVREAGVLEALRRLDKRIEEQGVLR
jgi:hypothetical protein